MGPLMVVSDGLPIAKLFSVDRAMRIETKANARHDAPLMFQIQSGEAAAKFLRGLKVGGRGADCVVLLPAGMLLIEGNGRNHFSAES